MRPLAASCAPQVLTKENAVVSVAPGTLTHVAGFMPGVMKKLGMGVECDDIAKTMVHSLLAPAADVADVFENNDIMATARVYEKELAGHETCA